MNKQKITLGYVLRKYRSKSNLDIDRLSYKISTDIDYIIALEKGNYKIFTSFNQALPIIRKLSYTLGLKYQSLVELYNKEYEFYIHNNNNNIVKSKTFINYNLFKFSGGLIVGIVILGYLILQVYQMTYSPIITLDNAQPYQFYDKEEYKLNGNLSRASQLTLNGQKVTIKEDGNFEALLNLQKGENRIELSVKKDNKFVKTLQKTIYRQ
jgi:cytoskeletal protein RodZ